MPDQPTTTQPCWTFRQPDRTVVADLVRKEGVPETVAELLANRGFKAGGAVHHHLHPDLKRLHDPFLLPGMREATQRLTRAIDAGETILVHGDYDVDGVTGTVLLTKLFEHLGAKAVWHIPNRFTDGYSFGQHSIDRAREVGASVVISVDNGTSAAETIGELKALGVDTIVTDHHEPPQGALPDAVAIVNPKLVDSTYPFRELCGGAVAFKLAWGLCQEISGATRVRNDLRDFLIEAMGYVAIATVCDVVPLVDENRILARFGLRALEQRPSPGVRALLHVSGLGGCKLGAEDVGFQIGPRLNASGRLATAARAVDVLLAKDDDRAGELATALDEMNQERRRIERELLTEAEQQAEAYADAERWPVLVVAGQGWHQGVVGIVAARLVDRAHRPALVIGLDGEEGRGSARSVAGFSVLEAMHGGAEHMQRYGGHAAAAGCEVRAEAIDDLREAVCAKARELLGDGGYARPELVIDTELELPLLDAVLMRQIDRLEPFGEQNEKPILLSRDVRLDEAPRVIGATGAHLLLRLRRGERVLKALAFGMAARVDELALGAPLDVVYTPRWNTFRGETNLELVLHDFRASEPKPA
ncbi:MAG: single-stranded-DNA-specific exonuclease RecJ [bacterium]|nr:single-stranded-DNA-specific exonuclease RecJ [bacterium]